MPYLDDPVIDARMRDKDDGFAHAQHVGKQEPRSVIGRVGGENGAHAVRGHERTMSAALDLGGEVAAELVAIKLHRLPVHRTQVRAIGDVVDHFLGVAGDRAEVIELPAYPLRVEPLR